MLILIAGIVAVIIGIFSIVLAKNNKGWDSEMNSCQGIPVLCRSSLTSKYNSKSNEFVVSGVAMLLVGLVIIGVHMIHKHNLHM